MICLPEQYYFLGLSFLLRIRDADFTCKITLSCVYVTIVAMEKQEILYILSVCLYP